MYSGEKGYLKLLNDIMENGDTVLDRTGTGTISLFAPGDIKFDLSEGFPLLTTKKMGWKTIAKELQWFLSGSTNVKDLIDMNCNIWNADAYRWFRHRVANDGIGLCEKFTIDDYIENIKNNDNFASTYGDLGPIYGKQWRDFNGVDQLDNLIKGIKEDPNGRRHIISGWNPGDQSKMALPPCHVLYHFNVTKGKLNLKMYQRSGDMFLGVPFNIASSCMLLSIVAKECNLEPGVYTHSLGDAHIYLNHIKQVSEQITRKPFRAPKLVISDKVDIFNFSYEDVLIEDYNHHPAIKGDVSVGK